MSRIGVFIPAAAVWLSAACVSMCVLAMLCLLGILAVNGLTAFWPKPVESLRIDVDGRQHDLFAQVLDQDGDVLILRSSEPVRIGEGYQRVRLAQILARSQSADVVEIELNDGRLIFTRADITTLQKAVAAHAALALPQDDPAHDIVLDANEIYRLRVANEAGYWQRFDEFASQFWRFLSSGPTSANPGGGILPALIGTMMLVLLMSVLVMPLGVLAAVYLHEQATSSRRAQVLRSAVNNLAGVPSIIYGLIGLALFVHQIGGSIDQLFYSERLPTPTFGSGGLLWAALTLALLTLPVVIVTTEEGLARVPQSLREGSLALGATRAETLWYLSLPLARPALLTGLVLAIARAAGEVAPLMLVGVVKLAPAGVLDAQFPYLHPTREFMHLGYQVYDKALQGADAWRAAPRAYACALVLLLAVVALNLCAILLRNRLRARYRSLSY
jgi:phosphate transport system permease protein